MQLENLEIRIYFHLVYFGNMFCSYKTNANPKINILILENIGQRRLNFSVEYFDALFYHHFQPNKILKSAQNTF